MRLLPALLAVALALAADPSPAEQAPAGGYGVTRPGEVLFDREARRQALAAMADAERRWLCGTTGTDWPSHAAITTVRAPAGYGADPRAEPFAWTVMTAAAAAFGLEGEPAARALIGNLRRWAQGRALTKLAAESHDNYYSIDRTLLPTIVAFALVRDHPALEPETRSLIRDWLEEVVRRRGEARPTFPDAPMVEENNHRYLRDSVDMAWGALTGDDARFRRGIESYRLALSQMAEDGSLPLEVQRGARALWYQRHAIASLVAIAEMAAVQGHDLYALEVDGRSLHLAIRFLLDAIEDPRRVWPHARANVNPGPYRNYRVQDLGFLWTRGHGRHYMAWSEPYMARFPGRPESRRLAAKLEAFDPRYRPMVDEYVGGAASCYFAPSEEGDRAALGQPQRE